MRNMLNWAYFNGKIISQNSAVISVFDNGLQYGHGVFTTLKVRVGFPLFLNRHLTRLKSNARTIDITLPPGIKKSISEIITANSLKNGGLRVTISENPVPPYITSSASCSCPTVVIRAFTLDHANSEKINAITLPDTRDKYKTIKTIYRLPHLMAQKYARNKGAQDALFTNGKFLIESTYANIISFANNKIITPPIKNMGFNGIIRQILMESLPVQEKNIPSGALDPMILVNSLGFRVVNSINGRILRQNKEFINLIAGTIDKYEKSYINRKLNEK